MQRGIATPASYRWQEVREVAREFQTLAREWLERTGCRTARRHESATGPALSAQPTLGSHQKRFSVCGCVKRDGNLSVEGHGSLRGHGHRVCPRLMMVFGGGSSPMSFAG
jgi:hypothetical protein